MENENKTQEEPSSDDIVVTGRYGNGDVRLKGLQNFSIAVTFIGGFAFNSLGKFNEPVDGDPGPRAIAYLSLLFLVAATVILLYSSVIISLTVAVLYRVRALDGVLTKKFSEKLLDELSKSDNVFQISKDDWSKKQVLERWNASSNTFACHYGTHLVTCPGIGAMNAMEKEEKINELELIMLVILNEIYYGDCENSGDEKPFRILTLMYGDQKKNKERFQKWDKKDEPPKPRETGNAFKLESEYKSLTYKTIIGMVDYLFWSFPLHFRLFPLAIVFLFAGQALQICASSNLDAVVSIILVVFLVPFLILMAWRSTKLLNILGL